MSALRGSAADGRNPLMDGRALHMHFPIRRGLLQRTSGYLQAVDGVDLSIAPGQSIGLVGESGSGKSTIARLITRLLEPTGGILQFMGVDITHASQRIIRPMRRHLQMVFQNPYSSLAPLSSVRDSVAEPLRTQLGMRGAELDHRTAELFEQVRLSSSLRTRYPHELSGGQLQRISIARALATHPQLLVLDEPVSSLDVSTQAEVINLLTDLREELKLSYLFIAHDLAVVRHVSDQIAVMYLGRIVEHGDSERVYTDPKHPYTQALLSAIPTPDPLVQRGRERIVLKGDIPSPANPPLGCRFHTRCPHVMDICRTVDPPVTLTDDGTTVYCHLHSSASSNPTATRVLK
jgi:oligopeptide/dipeptide ABC transporter ATP-binding protein